MARQSKYVLGYVTDGDLRLLRIFSTIVECGGITAAESELNMANSTLSTHLATLEDHLRMKLCTRGRAGFKLTAEGRAVHEAAKQLFQSLDEFRRSVLGARVTSPSRLSILVPDALICAVFDKLLPVFRRFATEVPDVFLDIDIASPAQIDQAVIDGKADMGITSSVRRTHNLRFHDLKMETTALYCGKGHPLFGVSERSLRVEKIVKYNFVRAYGSYYPKKILRALQGVGSSSCIPLDARALLVATGHYLGLMPEDFARPYVQRGLLRELMPGEFRYSYPLSIVTKPTTENAALGRFLEILQRELESAGSIQA